MSWPPVKAERNKTNVGFIRNVNAAAKRAKGDYLILLNQDVKAITPGWADMLVSVMHSDETIGITGPKLLFPESMGGGIQSCGGLFDAGKGPYHRFLGWKGINDRRVNTSMVVSWITGACLAIRRADFEQVGGLDDKLYQGGYFDDVDLCMKVRYELHKDIFYCAEAVLEHQVGTSGGTQFFMQNSRAFHQKWNDKIVPDTTVVYVNY